MTWTKTNEDAFGFVNERIGLGGGWEYMDEWGFTRKPVREIWFRLSSIPAPGGDA